MITAKIIEDSVNEWGDRLTTFELVYPRFVHAQLLTHRTFSRNAASSRAIPIKRMIKRIKEDPVKPLHWGKAQSGMQAYEELTGWRLWAAKFIWWLALKFALFFASLFNLVGAHKQYANRILEPFMHITTIVTATDFSNFFYLRCGDAQPEIQKLAQEMYFAYKCSAPKQLKAGEWHTPYVVLDDPTHPLYVPSELGERFKEISSARCARVSYLSHDGVRDFQKDIGLHDRLTGDNHWSPTEHVAQAQDHSLYIGNFRGWKQYRKFFDNECVKEYNG